ncbi:energy transducer TonB [Arenimonas aestuarii]
MTRLLTGLFALLLALPAVAADRPFERPVVVRVDVDTTGSVVGAEAVGDLPKSLASVAESATGDVEFEPARVNGRAAASRTHVVVQMRFEPQGDDSVSARALKVEAATPVLHPPVYPTRAAQRGYGAHLVMRIELNADGSVDMDRSGLAAISLWKGARKLEDSQAFRDDYVAEVMKVMQHWKPMIEEVEGAPVATSWHVPVTFCPANRPITCDKIKADSPAATGRTANDDGIRLASLKPAAAKNADS